MSMADTSLPICSLWFAGCAPQKMLKLLLKRLPSRSGYKIRKRSTKKNEKKAKKN
jgi:hypothetical protein